MGIAHGVVSRTRRKMDRKARKVVDELYYIRYLFHSISSIIEHVSTPKVSL